MRSRSRLARVAFVVPVVAIVAACSGTSSLGPGGLGQEEEGPRGPDAAVPSPAGGQVDGAVPPRVEGGRPGADSGGDIDADVEPADDGGVEDGGDSGDGSVDGALADGAVPLEPCGKKDAAESRECGKCGTQSRVCKIVDGQLAWLPWGECIRETGVCYPGSVVNEPCGRCGVRKKVCNSSCQVEVVACEDRPGAECYAGDGDWQEALSCPSGLGRSRACQPVTCRWGTFSDDCQPYANPYFLVASPVAGAGNGSVRAQTFPLPSTRKAPRLPSYGSCPLTTTTPLSLSTPASYVEVRNPSRTASLKVTIWQSGTPETPTASMILAAYLGLTQLPATEAERKACSKGVSSYCSTSLCGSSSFGVLEGANAVTLPPGGTALVYSARFSDEGTPDDRYQLNVRTDQVIPVPDAGP